MQMTDQKVISFFAKGWAVFFAILLSLTMVLVLLSFTLNFTLFNANYFKGILEKQGFYEQLPQLVVVSAIENATVEAQSGETSNNAVTKMNSEQLAQLINIVLPEGYLQSQVERNIEAALNFVNLHTSKLDIIIDMQPVKDNLLSPEGQEAIVGFINTLPECTEDEVIAILQSQNRPDTTTEVSMCKPPELYIDAVMPQIQSSLQDFAGSMPAEMILVQDQSQIQQLTSSTPFRIYTVLRVFLSYMPFIAGALALLIILLTLRSVKTMFACLGIPLLVSGIIGGISSAAIQLGGMIMMRSVQTTGNPFDPFIKTTLDTVLREFSTLGLILCGTTILIGVIFLLISKAAKR